jgi:hypothetical protein
MTKIIKGKNNMYGGTCQVCKKRMNEINEIWNEDIKHDYGDEPELKICNNCLKGIINAFIDES